MATALSKLEKQVKESLQKRFEVPVETNSTDGEQPVSIGWELLIGPIIDVILSLLDGCLAKRSRNEVTESVMKNNRYTQFRIDRAVAKSRKIEPEMEDVASDTIIEVMTNNTREDVDELVKEFKQERDGWGEW